MKFPLIVLVTTVSTNWVSIPGDLHREGGTNLVHEQQVVTTNVHTEVVTLCTNYLSHGQVSSGTNGVHRWTPVAVAPGTPGRL